MLAQYSAGGAVWYLLTAAWLSWTARPRPGRRLTSQPGQDFSTRNRRPPRSAGLHLRPHRLSPSPAPAVIALRLLFLMSVLNVLSGVRLVVTELIRLVSSSGTGPVAGVAGGAGLVGEGGLNHGWRVIAGEVGEPDAGQAGSVDRDHAVVGQPPRHWTLRTGTSAPAAVTAAASSRPKLAGAAAVVAGAGAADQQGHGRRLGQDERTPRRALWCPARRRVAWVKAAVRPWPGRSW